MSQGHVTGRKCAVTTSAADRQARYKLMWRVPPSLPSESGYVSSTVQRVERCTTTVRASLCLALLTALMEYGKRARERESTFVRKHRACNVDSRIVFYLGF